MFFVACCLRDRELARLAEVGVGGIRKYNKEKGKSAIPICVEQYFRRSGDGRRRMSVTAE